MGWRSDFEGDWSTEATTEFKILFIGIVYKATWKAMKAFITLLCLPTFLHLRIRPKNHGFWSALILQWERESNFFHAVAIQAEQKNQSNLKFLQQKMKSLSANSWIWIYYWIIYAGFYFEINTEISHKMILSSSSMLANSLIIQSGNAPSVTGRSLPVPFPPLSPRTANTAISTSSEDTIRGNFWSYFFILCCKNCWDVKLVQLIQPLLEVCTGKANCTGVHHVPGRLVEC